MPKKSATPADEKLDKQDFVLFEALDAIDRKDYGYYDRLSPEQQKKFVPYMMVQWISALKGSPELQSYYVQSTNIAANTYLFNENVQKNPKLQWLMLCAASPGMGKQFHKYIPQLKEKVRKYKEDASLKDIKDYFKKVYPSAPDRDVTEVAKAYVDSHKKKKFISDKFPLLKYDEIELLAEIITDEDIENYEKDLGN